MTGSKQILRNEIAGQRGGSFSGSSYVLSYRLNTKMDQFIIFITIPAVSILHSSPELLHRFSYSRDVSWYLITVCIYMRGWTLFKSLSTVWSIFWTVRHRTWPFAYRAFGISGGSCSFIHWRYSGFIHHIYYKSFPCSPTSPFMLMFSSRFIKDLNI